MSFGESKVTNGLTILLNLHVVQGSTVFYFKNSFM